MNNFFRQIQYRLAFVLWLLAACVNPAHAQGAIQLPTTVAEYTPFEVVVQTSKRYCFDARFPLLGEVQYSAGTLSVVLTHLSSPLRPLGNAITCGQERRFMLPGLPRGQQKIKVDITDASDVSIVESSGANVSETLVATAQVYAYNNAELGYFWTGTFTPGLGGAVGFLLTPTRQTVWLNEWDWLEVGFVLTGYTFRAFSFAEADRLPADLLRLYSVKYPRPFGGAFWTTDKSVAQRLAGEWANPLLESAFAVGRVSAGGACPIGMSPVYQTFNARATSHRWTQSRTAYSALLANGYAGEGVAWCAPALRGE